MFLSYPVAKVEKAGGKGDQGDLASGDAIEDVKQPAAPDIDSEEAARPIDKPADNGESSNQLSEVLSLLKSVEESRKLGTEQQTENARYLQELNKVSICS